MSKSQMNTVLITFFKIKGIVYLQFIPQCQTVNKAYYVEILKWLYEIVLRERPELQPNDWTLHHDNAPAHKLLSVKQFLAQKLNTEMEHPPISFDLALNDFWLFPEIKSALKGQRYQDTEDVPQM
jgi:predicted Abi (CAAX) family protease